MNVLNIIDNMSIWSGKIVRWLAMVLSLVVLYEIIARYVFNRPTIWAFDLAMMISSTMFLMGAAFIQYQKGHIRVDVLFDLMPKRVRTVLDISYYLFLFFPFCLVMIWYGNKIAYMAWIAEEISNTSQWGEPVYHWRYVIPLAFLLFFLQGLADCVRLIHSLGSASEKQAGTVIAAESTGKTSTPQPSLQAK
ncbi:MAG: TRAP transporter small permease subunit [Syntrophobacteraceae bacterium]